MCGLPYQRYSDIELRLDTARIDANAGALLHAASALGGKRGRRHGFDLGR